MKTQVTGKYSGLYNPFSGGCAHNFCLILCGPRYPKRKPVRHYHSQSRGLGRGGVYYRAEDVKIFTDKEPQTKSINTLLNSPKTYNRDHHYQPHSGRQGSIHSTSSKPSTAGSKQVTSRSSTSTPPSSAPGPSGGVVIYYSPATSAVAQVTACDPPKEGDATDVVSHQSSKGSDLKLEESNEIGKKGASSQPSVIHTNKIMSTSSASCTTSPSSSSSASTVIHQPMICNQETAVIKSTSSMTSVTNRVNESTSVTPTTRMTVFKKYEISV